MSEQAVKKEWETPELIILVRSNPEESVLVACKLTDLSGSLTTHVGCWALNYGWRCDEYRCSRTVGS